MLELKLNHVSAEIEKNVKVSFKISHNRHHNVNIITFSTGLAEVVMDLNITIVGNDIADEERFARHML